jgi:hypothetical protein
MSNMLVSYGDNVVVFGPDYKLKDSIFFSKLFSASYISKILNIVADYMK